MMRRNNLGLLEKNCATKNVIWENCFNWRLFWSHGLEQAVASPPSRVNSVLTTRKLWGGLPQHSVICAVFSRIFIIIIIINHHHHHIIIIISSSSYHITILAKFTTYSAERKREKKILPSLNTLDSWSFNLNVFPFQVLAWMNCH